MQKKKDELLDLVDDEGNIIGQELRSVVYARGMKNFRVVDIFIKNSQGDFFICKRSSAKAISPGKFESCGEHVNPGETDLQAARRALQEEFGLDIPPLQFEFIGYTTPSDGASGYSAVFQATIEQQPVLGREHETGDWMSSIEIMTMLRENPRQFRSNILNHFAKHARVLFPNTRV